MLRWVAGEILAEFLRVETGLPGADFFGLLSARLLGDVLQSEDVPVLRDSRCGRRPGR